MTVETVEPPAAGLWRVARGPDPLAPGELLSAGDLDDPRLGNRFDSPRGSYRALYFATGLEGCFGETLARFRPDIALPPEISEEPGFMAAGEVPADWRQRRVAARVELEASAAQPTVAFLDVEAARTRQFLRRELARTLALYGHDDLDVATVRGADRRITRWIGEWANEQRDEEDRPLYAGVRYLSRLNNDWECWAAFDRGTMKVAERLPILRDNPDLEHVAQLFELRVF